MNLIQRRCKRSDKKGEEALEAVGGCPHGTAEEARCEGGEARTEGEEVTAIVHHRVTEVYYVLEGSGILVTGGDESNALEFPADNSSVLILIGPSGRRTVVNGQEQTVKPGDIVVIPAGVPHGFRHIQDQVTYLSVRVDPDQTLPTGYAHPSIAD